MSRELLASDRDGCTGSPSRKRPYMISALDLDHGLWFWLQDDISPGGRCTYDYHCQYARDDFAGHRAEQFGGETAGSTLRDGLQLGRTRRRRRTGLRTTRSRGNRRGTTLRAGWHTGH